MNSFEIIGLIASLIGTVIWIAIIVALVSFVRRRLHPNAVPKSGYCLSRTRKRLAYLGLSIIFLIFALALGVYSVSLLGEDRSLWDYMDYIMLVIGIVATVGFAAAGIYEGFTSVRDALFPDKSRLAASIRSQLPYPDEAPGYQELFAMVDKDIEENGQWFDRVGIGKEWVLGDDASFIPRIRAVFARNEVKIVHRGNRTQSTRTVQLIIVDDRRQVQITGLRDPRELDAAISCLKLRTPAAYFSVYNEYIGYCNKTDEEWAIMERRFRERKERLEASQENKWQNRASSNQDFVLIDTLGLRTSLVTREAVLEQIGKAKPGTGFALELLNPLPERQWGFLHKLQWTATAGGIVLIATTAQTAGGSLALRKVTNASQAQEIMLTLLEQRRISDLSGWEPFQLDDGPDVKERRVLILTDKTGLTREYETYTRRDVELAAVGLAGGTYINITLHKGASYLNLKAGDAQDGRVTAKTARVDADMVRWFTTKCTDRQAGEWLLALEDGHFFPDLPSWKDITKQQQKEFDRSKR